MESTIKFAIAVTFGSGIGAFVFRIIFHELWLLGVVVGGVIAGLIYLDANGHLTL